MKKDIELNVYDKRIYEVAVFDRKFRKVAQSAMRALNQLEVDKGTDMREYFFYVKIGRDVLYDLPGANLPVNDPDIIRIIENITDEPPEFPGHRERGRKHRPG